MPVVDYLDKQVMKKRKNQITNEVRIAKEKEVIVYVNVPREVIQKKVIDVVIEEFVFKHKDKIITDIREVPVEKFVEVPIDIYTEKVVKVIKEKIVEVEKPFHTTKIVDQEVF